MIDDDIRGLHDVARDYTAAAQALDESSRFLNSKVAGVVHEAGWTGEAASAFQTAWASDGTVQAAMAEAMSQVADIVTVLADELSEARHELEAVQDQDQDQGQGQDQGQAQAVGLTLAEAALSRAQHVRQWAAQRLNGVAGQILPCDGSPETLGPADQLTLAEVLRGLYTAPAAVTEVGHERLERLQKQAADLKRAHAGVPKGSEEWDRMLEQRRTTRAALTEQRMSVSSVEGWAGKFKGSKGARLTVGEIADRFRGGRTGAVGAMGALSGVLTGATVYCQAEEDHEKGWSWGEAVAKAGGPAVAGLASGVLVESGVAAIGAAAPPVAVAATGVAAGAVLGYGVGTFGYELTHRAHFSRHIHQDGVVAGIGEGFADAGRAWADNDAVDLWHKGQNSARQVWRSLFG
ncbi:WXG100 family type VII secretion target [Streptoverticillium reticulum]|uniref:WXG100 family type VII secretion target n=1 Tax=Streptoverticillium reticulum TaxID=1433415 RepID=UPI0039BED536